MSHQNKASLVKQAEDILTSKLKIGTSKFNDKLQGVSNEHIYSWETFRNYLKISCRFLDFCKNTYGCKSVESARQYADTWLKQYISSPFTYKTYVAALCKLYGETSDGFAKSKCRERASIKRSRNDAIRDKHFSENKNKELIVFCQATGLRRKELENIRGNQLVIKESGYFISVKGKGGRIREVPIIGSDSEKKHVINRMISAGNNKVWGTVHSSADIHGYRREYCTRVYEHYKRPLNDLDQTEKYICRKDKSGTIYDRKAMEIASNALGHSRISVIAEHYL